MMTLVLSLTLLSYHWLVDFFFSLLPRIQSPLSLSFHSKDQRQCLGLPLPDQDTSSSTAEQHSSKVRADWWVKGAVLSPTGTGHLQFSLQEGSVAVVLPQKPAEQEEKVQLVTPTDEKVEVIKVGFPSVSESACPHHANASLVLFCSFAGFSGVPVGEGDERQDADGRSVSDSGGQSPAAAECFPERSSRSAAACF